MRAIVLSAVALTAYIVYGAPVGAFAQGPAAPVAANAQSSTATSVLSAQDISKAIQENNAAIQQFAAAHRQTHQGLKAVLDKLSQQSASFHSAVDQKVLSKDPKGVAFVKKEKALKDEITALAEKIKAKQAEVVALAPERVELMQKALKDPDYAALLTDNSQRTKALNEEMFTIVSQVSEEGKKLVDERGRLLALQKPATPPTAPAPAAKK